MNFIDTKIRYVVVMLVTAVNCQKPFMSVDKTTDGGNFIIHCDASRFSLPDSDPTDVFKLEINRKTVGTPNMLLARYRTSPSFNGASTLFNSPSGKDWDVTFDGYKGGRNNSKTMKIVIDVLKARCNDSGIYSCIISYAKRDGLSRLAKLHATITVTLGLYNFGFSAISKSLLYGQSQFKVGDNIIMTCRVTGSPDLLFVWEKWIRNTNADNEYIEKHIPETMITNEDPSFPRGTASCLRYDMMSTLIIPAQASDNQARFKCSAIYQHEVQNATITIALSNG